MRPSSSKPNAITYKLNSTFGRTTMLTTIPKPSTQKLLESRIYLYIQMKLLVFIKKELFTYLFFYLT